MTAHDESTPNAAAERSVVESLLDRPVEQIASFAGRSLTTWCRGVLDPWRLGAAIADNAPRLAPPFAFLVVGLFLLGVALRLWFLAKGAEFSVVLDNVGYAMGELSLARLTLVTLPCVIIVAAGGELLSRLGGRRGMEHRPQVARAVCYAIGVQSLTMAVLCGVFVATQTSDRDIVDTAVGAIVGLPLLWSVLIVAPAVKRRQASGSWWAAPSSVITSAVVVVAISAASLQLLGRSIELGDAAKLGLEREFAAIQAELEGDDLAQGELWRRALQADVLQTRSLAPGVLGEDRFELTVAYTNRTDLLIIIPRQERFTPRKWFRAFPARNYRVEASSLDSLADRALLIEPWQTRVAEYTLRLDRTATPVGAASPPEGSTPYRVSYYFRDSFDALYKRETILVPPREIAALRLGDAGVSGAGLLK